MMKCKKILCLLLGMLLITASGCRGRVVSQEPPKATAAPTEDGEISIKTGISLRVDLSDSEDAEPGGTGEAEAKILLTAVTVDDNGIIDDCALERYQTEIEFDEKGRLLAREDSDFDKVSESGGKWREQMDALADFLRGMTPEELAELPFNEKGEILHADLAGTVTEPVEDCVKSIVEAIENAEHCGAQPGDTLKIGAVVHTDGSGNAAEEDGTAQILCTAAAVTLRGETVSSCRLDEANGEVRFNGAGKITSPLPERVDTKNMLGAAYGMKGASSIGMEWNEQAKAFGAYVSGKTPEQLSGIAVSESGAAEDETLAATVTLKIGNFLQAIQKAAGAGK